MSANDAIGSFNTLSNLIADFGSGNYFAEALRSTVNSDKCCIDGNILNTPYYNPDKINSIAPEPIRHREPFSIDIPSVKEEEKTMNTATTMSSPNPVNDIFNGVFGRVAPDMCRISMSGNVAIKTASGYKSYNVKNGRLTNCSNFAFNIGDEAFFVMPTNHVLKGDIILVGGKPHCVISTEKNRIEAFCYEDSSVHIIVPEHHVFMGKSYLYGKIVSMFGDIGKGNGMKKMMNFMMLSQLMNRNGNSSGTTMDMLPMMMLMGGSGNGSIFDSMFDFDEDSDDEAEEVGEDE